MVATSRPGRCSLAASSCRRPWPSAASRWPCSGCVPPSRWCAPCCRIPSCSSSPTSSTTTGGSRISGSLWRASSSSRDWRWTACRGGVISMTTWWGACCRWWKGCPWGWPRRTTCSPTRTGRGVPAPGTPFRPPGRRSRRRWPPSSTPSTAGATSSSVSAAGDAGRMPSMSPAIRATSRVPPWKP